MALHAASGLQTLAQSKARHILWVPKHAHMICREAVRATGLLPPGFNLAIASLFQYLQCVPVSYARPGEGRTPILYSRT